MYQYGFYSLLASLASPGSVLSLFLVLFGWTEMPANGCMWAWLILFMATLLLVYVVVLALGLGALVWLLGGLREQKQLCLSKLQQRSIKQIFFAGSLVVIDEWP